MFFKEKKRKKNMHAGFFSPSPSETRSKHIEHNQGNFKGTFNRRPLVFILFIYLYSTTGVSTLDFILFYILFSFKPMELKLSNALRSVVNCPA